MPRGPNYGPEWKVTIKEVDDYLEKQNGVKPYAKEVVAEMERRESKRTTPRRVPQEKWTLKVMREPVGETLRRELDEMDRPWSILEGHRMGISADALRLLLQIRKWCITTGQTLTIGEAKWVDFLRELGPPEGWQDTSGESPDWSVDRQYRWAQLYARKERISKELNVPFDSSDLDIWFIGFHPTTLLTAEALGIVKPLLESLTEEVGDLRPDEVWFGGGNPVAPSLIKALPRLSYDPPSTAKGGAGEQEIIYRILNGLNNYQIRESYALLLNHVCRAPRWRGLSDEKKFDIARRLSAWVLEQEEAYDSDDPTVKQELTPKSILNEVGYQSQQLTPPNISNRYTTLD
jgi:hypothetical protein